MKLNHLSDQQLLKDMKQAVTTERVATLAVLEHIQEVHRRKLFAELGYSSLFKYLVKELSYSEGQAYRRIQAARLVDTVPEVKAKLASGSINLTNAAKLQSFFSEEKIDKDLKDSVINQIEHKTTRECDDLIAKIKQPNMTSHFQLNFKLDEAQKEKWDRLQGLLAHKKLSKEALLEEFMELALKQLDPAKPKVRRKIQPGIEVKSAKRAIPASMKHQLWVRSKGCCEWTSSDGKKCESSWALQIDHRQPYATGGETALHNLQLLCQGHHQRKTVREWGVRK